MVAPVVLWRYIAREVTVHAALALAVLTLLGVLLTVLRRLEDLLAAGVSLGGTAHLALTALPSFLPYAAPPSLLFGVLLTFGRMAGDGEVIAIRAAGVSVRRLLPPVVALGLVGSAVTAYLLYEREPRSQYRLKMLARELGSAAGLIAPGSFRRVGSRTLFVAETGPESCPYRGILIGEPGGRGADQYVAARCGMLVEGTAGGLALELVDGSIHFSGESAGRYSRIRFQRMRTELDLSTYVESAPRPRAHTVPELLELRRRYARGEQPRLRGARGPHSVDVQLHRRGALAAACTLLPLLGVPLGLRPLRAGRSAGALTAIGVMTLYWCVFTAGELAAERSWVGAAPGLWSANALCAGLGIWLLGRAPRAPS